jgi:hypothetical protein
MGSRSYAEAGVDIDAGNELVRRMKGWITVDPELVVKTVNEFGRLKVLDDRELVVEVEDRKSLEGLQQRPRCCSATRWTSKRSNSCAGPLPP